MTTFAETAPPPNAVAFRDVRHGVLASGDASSGGSISVTGDGGRTWRVVLRTRRPVSSVAYAGARIVWAGFDRGKSLRSSDGGLTWRRPAAGRFAASASFADERRGLAVAGPFGGGSGPLRIALTDDGGRTWRVRAGPCPVPVGFNAFVSRPTANLAWVLCVGQGGAGNEGKAVYRSRDGGRSWHALGRDGLSSYGYPVGISVAANGFGLLWETRGTLFVTRDGGRTWRGRPSLVRPEIDFGRSAVALPHGVGYELDGRGNLRIRLLATRDAGRTWRVVHRWR